MESPNCQPDPRFTPWTRGFTPWTRGFTPWTRGLTELPTRPDPRFTPWTHGFTELPTRPQINPLDLWIHLPTRWVQMVCDSRMLLATERLQKDPDPYVQQCVAYMQTSVLAMVPSITDAISGDVEQLQSRKGSRAGSAGSARGATPGTPGGPRAGTPNDNMVRRAVTYA
eukprot:7573968-Pyramimonas_sp.AAC.1